MLYPNLKLIIEIGSLNLPLILNAYGGEKIYIYLKSEYKNGKMYNKNCTALKKYNDNYLYYFSNFLPSGGGGIKS